MPQPNPDADDCPLSATWIPADDGFDRLTRHRQSDYLDPLEIDGAPLASPPWQAAVPTEVTPDARACPPLHRLRLDLRYLGELLVDGDEGSVRLIIGRAIERLTRGRATTLPELVALRSWRRYAMAESLLAARGEAARIILREELTA